MLHAEGLKGVLIFLAAAGIAVPPFHRARISPVLGFIIIGVALGPNGLGRLTDVAPWLWYVTFDDPRRGEVLAELGIIFLLFLLGLELSMRRLWELRRYLFGVGLAQVVVTMIVIGYLVRWLVAAPPAGIILGLCLALSSTAVVMQILVEQNRTTSPVGRVSLAVLLFQDLMVAPILFVVGILSGGGEQSIVAVIVPFTAALVAVPVLMITGRYAMGPLLRSAARTGSRELMLALALLIVISISVVTEAAGLSMALGAFLAGLLLSDSEYRHHIEVDIEPFKGLLLGLFFITVGMNVDLRVVGANAPGIALALVLLVVVKAVVLFVVARLFGIPKDSAAEVALLLAQAGEFTFVVVGFARHGGLLSPELATSVIAVAALSMMVTPALATVARRAGRRLASLDHEAHAPGTDDAEWSDHVVIGGYGRVGQMVGRLLALENVPFAAIDDNGPLVAEHRAVKLPVYYGDASRTEMLERAGARKARAFVVTLDAPGAAERMVKAILALQPGARVFARARDAAHAARLTALGAVAVPEAIEASLQLSGQLLEALGMPEEVVEQRLNGARAEQLSGLQRA